MPVYLKNKIPITKNRNTYNEKSLHNNKKNNKTNNKYNNTINKLKTDKSYDKKQFKFLGIIAANI